MKCREPIVGRYFFPCGKDLHLDDNGLLNTNPSFLEFSHLIDFEKFSALPGAILIGEGGIGKTTVFRQLKDSLPNQSTHFLELAFYRNDPVAFRENISALLQKMVPSENGCVHVVLDGLDEAPDLASTIIGQFRKPRKNVFLWISSRDISSVRTIQEMIESLSSYSLAPLSEQDVRKMATDSGIPDEAFWQEVSKFGVTGICAKPLGCRLVLSAFKEGRLDKVTQKELWLEGIRRLCDETPSNTKNLHAAKWTLEQVFKCATWVALCLQLSGKDFVWVGQASHTPGSCISLSDLQDNEISLDLLRETLGRGIFLAKGDDRICFSHSLYSDFLAAYGFFTFVRQIHWPSLILSSDRLEVLTQFVGVASWLAAFDDSLLSLVSTLQPEILLSSFDVVQRFGAGRLCEMLLNRSDFIGYQRRRQQVFGYLQKLASQETEKIVREHLQKLAISEAKRELAIRIAEECKFSGLSDLLVDQVLDVSQPYQRRVDAAYAVQRIGLPCAKLRLKKLLPISPESDPRDELLGNVLRCCWPEEISPADLVLHLRQPQVRTFGSYSVFLVYDLPKTFGISLDESGRLILLRWSMGYLSEHGPIQRLGKLARAIFSFCWRFASNPSMASYLADGFLAAQKVHCSPFLDVPPL